MERVSTVTSSGNSSFKPAVHLDLAKRESSTNTKRIKLKRELELKIQQEMSKQKSVEYSGPFSNISDFKLAVNDRNKVYIQVINRKTGEMISSIPFNALSQVHANFQKTSALLVNESL